jgi:hypothetical protein
VKTKLKQAAALVKAGDNASARELLLEVLKSDPTNDTAWVWMAAAVDKDHLRKECLEEALLYNPRNEAARRALKRLQTAGRVTYSRAADKPHRRQQTAVHGFSILLFLAGVMMAFINCSRYPQDLAFQTEGQATQARIVRLYQRTGRASGDYAEYVYDVGEHSYTGESRIPYQDWKQMQVGGTIKIRYLPSNPLVSRYYYENRGAPEEEYRRGWVVAGVLLVSPLVLQGTLLAAQAYTRKTKRR